MTTIETELKQDDQINIQTNTQIINNNTNNNHSFCSCHLKKFSCTLHYHYNLPSNKILYLFSLLDKFIDSYTSSSTTRTILNNLNYNKKRKLNFILNNILPQLKYYENIIRLNLNNLIKIKNNKNKKIKIFLNFLYNNCWKYNIKNEFILLNEINNYKLYLNNVIIEKENIFNMSIAHKEISSMKVYEEEMERKRRKLINSSLNKLLRGESTDNATVKTGWRAKNSTNTSSNKSLSTEVDDDKPLRYYPAYDPEYCVYEVRLLKLNQIKNNFLTLISYQLEKLAHYQDFLNNINNIISILINYIIITDKNKLIINNIKNYFNNKKNNIDEIKEDNNKNIEYNVDSDNFYNNFQLNYYLIELFSTFDFNELNLEKDEVIEDIVLDYSLIDSLNKKFFSFFSSLSSSSSLNSNSPPPLSISPVSNSRFSFSVFNTTSSSPSPTSPMTPSSNINSPNETNTLPLPSTSLLLKNNQEDENLSLAPLDCYDYINMGNDFITVSSHIQDNLNECYEYLSKLVQYRERFLEISEELSNDIS